VKFRVLVVDEKLFVRAVRFGLNLSRTYVDDEAERAWTYFYQKQLPNLRAFLDDVLRAVEGNVRFELRQPVPAHVEFTEEDLVRLRADLKSWLAQDADGHRNKMLDAWIKTAVKVGDTWGNIIATNASAQSRQFGRQTRRANPKQEGLASGYTPPPIHPAVPPGPTPPNQVMRLPPPSPSYQPPPVVPGAPAHRIPPPPGAVQHAKPAGAATPPPAPPTHTAPPQDTAHPPAPAAAPPPAPREPAVAATWKWQDIQDPLEVHDEFDARACEVGPGWTLIGARVRGKKHKHEGTNCDDWFEIATAGKWSLVAVSDGAGSKRLSRIGSQTACRAALDTLKSRLDTVSLDALQDKDFGFDSNARCFNRIELQNVQDALHVAMLDACTGVEEAYQARRGKPGYGIPERDSTERDLQLSDLSATLLLAVHTLLPDGRSFVMACQIGDGITAVVDHTGGLRLLGVPDSGGFSGETEFLTDKRMLDSGKLAERTYSFLGSMRAMMTATDGLTDPYFPSDPGMLRLYVDLLLNGVIEMTDDHATRKVSPGDETAAVPDTSRFISAVRIANRHGEDERHIRSAAGYADFLQKSVPELAANPGLLIGGIRNGPRMCSPDSPPQEKLRVWLDSFYVRGEFDDRTMVVLYREPGL
jgi:hypothetical protein